MSFFYLNPVKGDLPIHMLEDIVFKRFDFLSALLNGDTLVYDEYVIDGSVYDNVGHFIMCIILILSENKHYAQYYMRAESELFKKRLGALATRDLRTFAKKILRNLKYYDSLPVFYEPLKILCHHLQLKHIAQHVCIKSHERTCTQYFINLNFKHCLDLIAKREVDLKDGVVTLPCGKWFQYLNYLFKKSVKRRIHSVNLEPLRNDPRIMELVYKVKREKFVTEVTTNKMPKLCRKSVDPASVNFPPCMLNLHLQLRKRHRLSHEQRFYYSLFLKDIGMPVDEAIEFWRAEYRQSPSGKHSCTHNWEKDEKKYLYGIRHMYGLEGCRKSYTSVSCKRIQSMCNAGSEGGCPFKTFDHCKMIDLIQVDKKIIPELQQLKNRSQYTSACILYHKHKFVHKTSNCDSFSFNSSPVNFYSLFN